MSDDFFSQYMDPRWQKLAARMKEAYGWACVECGSDSQTIHVHHKQYFKGRRVWEYDEAELVVLCKDCHEKADKHRELVKKLLALESTFGIPALLGGFLEYDDAIKYTSPELLDEARFVAPIEYAAGFIAHIVSRGLSIDDMYRVAVFAASLTRPQSEERMRVATSGKLFGREGDDWSVVDA